MEPPGGTGVTLLRLQHVLKDIWKIQLKVSVRSRRSQAKENELLRDTKIPQDKWQQGELRSRQGEKLKATSIQSASYNVNKNPYKKEYYFICHYSIAVYCVTLY